MSCQRTIENTYIFLVPMESLVMWVSFKKVFLLLNIKHMINCQESYTKKPNFINMTFKGQQIIGKTVGLNLNKTRMLPFSIPITYFDISYSFYWVSFPINLYPTFCGSLMAWFWTAQLYKCGTQKVKTENNFKDIIYLFHH